MSVPFHYLHPSKLIVDRYSNKDKHDALGGIVVTQIEVLIVTRREQLCIFMKHEDFGYHEFEYVQRWVRFIREGSETHVFGYSEEK